MKLSHVILLFNWSCSFDYLLSYLPCSLVRLSTIIFAAKFSKIIMLWLVCILLYYVWSLTSHIALLFLCFLFILNKSCQLSNDYSLSVNTFLIRVTFQSDWLLFVCMSESTLQKDGVLMSVVCVQDLAVENEGVLMSVIWRRIIIDEAHCIKNHKSITALTVCRLKADIRWALSGTPIQNNLLDMYALLRLVVRMFPAYFGDRRYPFTHVRVFQRSHVFCLLRWSSVSVYTLQSVSTESHQLLFHQVSSMAPAVIVILWILL